MACPCINNNLDKYIQTKQILCISRFRDSILGALLKKFVELSNLFWMTFHPFNLNFEKETIGKLEEEK
jgi:hypothetical protein